MGKYRNKYQSITGIEEIKSFLLEEELGLIAFNKEGEDVFFSKKSGIIPLFELYQQDIGDDLVLWDRVIGAGAAFFINKMNIHQVRTPLISKTALESLESRIQVEYIEQVGHILNKKQDDLCPIEKMAQKAVDFDDFLNQLEHFFEGR